MTHCSDTVHSIGGPEPLTSLSALRYKADGVTDGVSIISERILHNSDAFFSCLAGVEAVCNVVGVDPNPQDSLVPLPYQITPRRAFSRLLSFCILPKRDTVSIDEGK